MTTLEYVLIVVVVTYLLASLAVAVGVLFFHHQMTEPAPPVDDPLPRATAKEHRRDEGIRRGC